MIKTKQSNIQESYLLRTSDSNILHFNEDTELIGFSGFGLVNFEYETRRGYKSDVLIVDEVLTTPRNATIVLRVKGDNTREGYWIRRRRIIDFFRQNRNIDNSRSSFQFTVALPTDERLSITARYASGLEFEAMDDSDNSFGFTVAIGFICFDPIWYTESDISVQMVPASADNLIFPITFPIVFESGGSSFGFPDDDIAYAGTWKTYPTITIQGPYTSATIRNTATDVEMALGTPISAGQTRIISRDDNGFFRVQDANGVNKISELSVGSQFGAFFIYPDSELPLNADGTIPTQNILMTLVDSGLETEATISYKERYAGI